MKEKEDYEIEYLKYTQEYEEQLLNVLRWGETQTD